jgi:hypothetical protein
MIDLIRNSQVPANLLQSAAKGSLSVPPGETIEILVYLAKHHKVFGKQASLTLASWDEKACLAAVSDPRTSAEVLGYFVALENLRTHLLPALAENPSVAEEALEEIAALGSRSALEALFPSPRVKSSPRLLKALQSNANLRPNEWGEIEKRLAPLKAVPPPTEATGTDAEATDADLDQTLNRYLDENAEELAAEKDKPFQPLGLAHEGTDGETSGEPESPAPEAAGHEAKKAEAQKPAAAVHTKKPAHAVHGEKRDSTLQKIAKLDIKGRIALAVRGSKEERSILIRDGTKLVALAVLESPKVTDGEVENFAQQKNVLESVLRAIPMKRRFAKNYNVVRNLVFNPRTPLDLSLGLMKNLLVHDLKNLSGNKEVAETIRKLALRMFKQKMEKKG